MAFAFKIQFVVVWYCLCLVFCIGRNTITASYEIQRAKVDTFTNLGCQKSNDCTEKRCAEYEAKCVDDKCERCQCTEDSATFLAHNSTTVITYKCVKDENVIPESVPEQQFRLEKLDKTTGERTNQCLAVVAVEQNYKIFGKSCNSSLNMHWIWTKTQQKKIFLMNIMTLQCVEFFECKNNTGKVALKRCNKTDGQYINVHGNAKTILNNRAGRNYYLRLEEQQNDVGYPSFSQRTSTDRWTNSKKDDLHLSNAPTTYKGCYRFQNKKFMLYLDRETCRENPCSHQFSAPIFYENAKCDVVWSESEILYSDNVQWQKLITETSRTLISIESNSSSIKMLKLYEKALRIFNGSLVKLAISCANKMDGKQKSVENHCLLVKFKSLSSEKKTLMKTPSPVPTTPIPEPPPAPAPAPTPAPTSTTQKTSLTESSINTVAIAVPVSLLAVSLVFALYYFMCYRKQKRSIPSRNTENPVTDENFSPVVKKLVEPTNPPKNNSQPTPTPQSPKYEIPQSPEYPERPQSNEYEYPSPSKPRLKEAIQQKADTTSIDKGTVGQDSGYTPLIRRPVNNDGNNGYTHLIDVQRKEGKAGATDKPDGLLNVMDGKFNLLKKECENSSNAHLINENKKRNDKQGAKKKKDEADELKYVVPMNSQYTALARPPLRNGESEDPVYQPLIKDRKTLIRNGYTYVF